MTKLRMILMATAAIIVTSAIATTSAQATDLRVSGITLAPSTFSTGQAGPTLKIDALKSTALQDKSFFDTTQVGTALKTLTIAGDKKAGDTKKATTGGLWAAILPSTVGFEAAMKVRTAKFELNTVIDRAKQPATSYKHIKRHALGVGAG